MVLRPCDTLAGLSVAEKQWLGSALPQAATRGRVCSGDGTAKQSTDIEG